MKKSIVIIIVIIFAIVIGIRFSEMQSFEWARKEIANDYGVSPSQVTLWRRYTGKENGEATYVYYCCLKKEEGEEYIRIDDEEIQAIIDRYIDSPLE